MTLLSPYVSSLYAPFPVETPYRTGPVMAKLGHVPGDSGQHFVVDSAYEVYLEQKLAQLTAHPERCGGLSPGQHERLEEALLHIFRRIAETQPTLVRCEERAVWLEQLGLKLHIGEHVYHAVEPFSENAPLSGLVARAKAHLDMQPGPRKLLHAFALSVQEDVVVLRDLDGSDEVECLCVAFPSHWDPQTQVGRDFSALHQPVPHNGALLKSHRPVMNALFYKGPFVRSVWGLSAEGDLSQHPLEHSARPRPSLEVSSPEALAERLFFRTERQVSYPLPEWDRCLFTIRVAVQPLKVALLSDARRQRLATSLASMDDALLTYKGLTAWREPLLAYLAA